MSGPVILAVVIVTFLGAAAATFFLERRGIARDLAQWDEVFRHARAGVIANDRPPFQAPLSGRPALGVHIEVVVRERTNDGSVEHTTHRRVFEEAFGAVRLDAAPGVAGDVAFDGARLLRLPDDAPVYGATVFAPSTSMFAGAPRLAPAHVHQFLVARGLPLPTVDTLFSAGLGVMVNERVLVPGTPCWIAETDDGLRFDLGTVAESRATFTKRFTPIWNAFVVGMIVSIVAGMLVALVPGLFK